MAQCRTWERSTGKPKRLPTSLAANAYEYRFASPSGSMALRRNDCTSSGHVGMWLPPDEPGSQASPRPCARAAR